MAGGTPEPNHGQICGLSGPTVRQGSQAALFRATSRRRRLGYAARRAVSSPQSSEFYATSRVESNYETDRQTEALLDTPRCWFAVYQRCTERLDAGASPGTPIYS